MRGACYVLILGVAFTISAATIAEAKGSARVQQSDGSVQTYPNVSIRIRNKTLRITTADGKGTLIIDKAACSYLGALQRCLPYSIMLHQGGGDSRINFDQGTVYANLTDARQQLPQSSTQIPPRGILLALRTKAGTYITLSGTIDEMKP
jgi:hypothetical protein